MDYVKAWIHQAMIINLISNFAAGAGCLLCSKVVAPHALFGFCVLAPIGQGERPQRLRALGGWRQVAGGMNHRCFIF